MLAVCVSVLQSETAITYITLVGVLIPPTHAPVAGGGREMQSVRNSPNGRQMLDSYIIWHQYSEVNPQQMAWRFLGIENEAGKWYLMPWNAFEIEHWEQLKFINSSSRRTTTSSRCLLLSFGRTNGQMDGCMQQLENIKISHPLEGVGCLATPFHFSCPFNITFFVDLLTCYYHHNTTCLKFMNKSLQLRPATECVNCTALEHFSCSNLRQLGCSLIS